MNVAELAAELGLSEDRIKGRVASYQDFIRQHTPSGVAVRPLQFFGQAVHIDRVFAAGQACGFDVAWRASVHFSWCHILADFEALKPASWAALNDSDTIVHGLLGTVRALQTCTVRSSKPRFPLTLEAVQSMVVTDLADAVPRPTFVVSLAMVAAAAWKSRRGHVEQWQKMGGDCAQWLLDAEPCDAYRTVFVNAGLPYLPPALHDVRAAVLNAAFVMHACMGHHPDWDVQFEGMHHNWAGVAAYLHSLQSLPPCTGRTTSAGAVAAELLPPLEPQHAPVPDFATAMGAMRMSVTDYREDFAWMLVGAYADFLTRSTATPLDEVCSVLAGCQEPTLATSGPLLASACRRDRPARTWADIFIVCQEDHDPLPPREAPREAPRQAPGEGLVALEAVFIMASREGARAIVVIDDDLGRAPCGSQISKPWFADLRFARATSAVPAPPFLSRRHKACRDLRRLDLVLEALNDAHRGALDDVLAPARAFAAAAVFMTPYVNDVWEFADCAARVWLSEFLGSSLTRLGVAEESQCCVQGPWCTEANAALWWWMLRLGSGSLPPEWTDLVVLLAEVSARNAGQRPLLSWAVFARVWHLHRSKRLQARPPGAPDVASAAATAHLYVDGAKVLTAARGDGPWRVVGHKQWIAVTDKSEHPDMLGLFHDAPDPLHMNMHHAIQHLVFQETWAAGAVVWVPWLVSYLNNEDAPDPPLPLRVGLQPFLLPDALAATVASTFESTRYLDSTTVALTLVSCRSTCIAGALVDRLAGQVVHVSTRASRVF